MIKEALIKEATNRNKEFEDFEFKYLLKIIYSPIFFFFEIIKKS